MLKKYITEKLSKYIYDIKDKNIYAISILVTCNEGNQYKDIENFMSVSVNYNCENNNQNEFKTEEEKWNIAFWDDSNEYIIIDPEDNARGAEILYEWYHYNNINNVGYEDEDENKIYDNNMNYIGNGPNGYKELCLEISKIIQELRGTSKVGDILQGIPVLITDYDYSWYIINFITIANPNNEASDFLNYYQHGMK